jgi:hypothetical protein
MNRYELFLSGKMKAGQLARLTERDRLSLINVIHGFQNAHQKLIERRASGKRHHLATLTCQDKQPSQVGGEAYRAQFEQRLHDGLDGRCEVTRRGRKIFVAISGDFTQAQLDHLARGVARIWEGEAA